MPDESKVKTPQTATVFWMDSGRVELTTGFTLRVTPEEDIAAFPNLELPRLRSGPTC